MGHGEKVCNKWFVYLLRCSDGSLHTGITKDVKADDVQDVAAASLTSVTQPPSLGSRAVVESNYDDPNRSISNSDSSDSGSCSDSSQGP